VNGPALETTAAPLVMALDEAVRKAHPDFDVAVKYKMLTYSLHSD
jgi:hypothetical protein